MVKELWFTQMDEFMKETGRAILGKETGLKGIKMGTLTKVNL